MKEKEKKKIKLTEEEKAELRKDREIKKASKIRPVKNSTKIIKTVLWLSLVVALVLIFLYGYNLTHSFVVDRDNTDIVALVGDIDKEDAIIVDVDYGSNTEKIAEQLGELGIIKDETIFKYYSVLMGNEGDYKAGKHYVNKNIDYDNPIGYDMLIHILSQDAVPNPTARIFLAEGLTFVQTVERFVENGFVDEGTFIEACNNGEYDYEFVELIPTSKDRINRLEGYLFPDTYIFDITTGAEPAIEKMLSNFSSKLKDVYVNRMEELDLTLDDILIIASLIEREAQTDEDRFAIAGVIYNRLNTDDSSLQRLQIDATIQYYLLNTEGSVKEELTYEDLEIDTPYNTYIYTGLPPGPICNPGEKSIIAALYPDEHGYYYYVAKGDGSHVFATTLDEHNNNVAKYID